MSRLSASRRVQWPATALKAAVCGPVFYCLLTTAAHATCNTSFDCNDDLSALLAAEEAVLQQNGNALRDAGLEAGVSISVDGETIVGTPSRDDANRRTDVDLEAVDIQVKFDGLGDERSLSVSTAEEARIHTPDALIEFAGYWNYPDWIDRAEVRIYPAPGLRRTSGNTQPVAVVPMSREGAASWLPGADAKGDHFYVLRVYDGRGRFDETEPLPLVISDDPLRLPAVMLNGDETGRGIIAERPASPLPANGTNQLARAGIPVNGGVVTVYGKHVPEGLAVRVMDREVPVAGGRDFVMQRILPTGEHVVDVSVYERNGGRSVEFERDINIPDSEWFYVGLADLTVGKRTGDDSALLAPAKPGEYDSVYRKGRLAFYLKGKVQGRYIITAALDTDEEDLDTLFSNMDKKDPRQLLRRLDPDDYYPVYGDDSLIKEDAPTSGKFYVRVDRGRSHVMWGNFKTRVEGIELARYERGLYGAKANLETETATVYGDPASVPIREDFPLSATNPYGRTKLMIEEILCDAAAANPGLSVCLLRYFNPVGAHPSGRIGEDPNGIPNNLMPYISQVAVGRLPALRVFGGDYPTPDGTGVRDYIHVVDLAKGHVAALKKIETGAGVYTYNLGTGTGYSVLDVLHAFETACGKQLPYQIVARRPGDIAACYADPEKAAAELGWRAEFGIGRMCEDTWRWQSQNPDGYCD